MTGYLLQENASLLARSTMRVPARAGLLVDVRRADALPELFGFPYLKSKPVLMLGEGSNVLFAGDFDGVVVTLGQTGIRVVDDDGEVAQVRVEAAERWDDFVRWSLARGFAGLENLTLIPGAVGAAPIQNIGAYGTEVGEFIATVEAFDRDTQQVVRIDRAACAFGYRDSAFKRAPERHLIIAVEFRLPRRHPLRLDYPGVREELQRIGAGDAPRPVHIAEAISRIRTRKLPNPALIGNLGSFFKNPLVDPATADALQREFPALPQFGASHAGAKLSSAWMIEHCGWKGHRAGDAGVSEQHALVLVNHGAASGAQILDLARSIADSVQARFGVGLEPEPRIIGATW